MRVQLRDESTEDESTEHEVRVESIGGVPRRVFVGTALVVGLIAVALIKPWGDPSARVPPPPPPPQVAIHATPSATPVVHAAPSAPPAVHAAPSAPPAVRATAAPSADPELSAEAAGALCIAVPTWRLITIENSELGDTRTMYAIPAVTAAGPEDAAIPKTDITAKQLIAMGVCRPLSAESLGDGSPAPVVDAHIWAFGSDGQPVQETTSVLNANLFSFGEAYYAPASRAPGSQPGSGTQSAPTWMAGRYAVEIPNGAGKGESLWFAVDFATHATLS